LAGKETKNAAIACPRRIGGCALFPSGTGQDFAIFGEKKVVRTKAFGVFVVGQQPGNELGLAIRNFIDISACFTTPGSLIVNDLGRATAQVLDLGFD
jgi:hypothetical protein